MVDLETPLDIESENELLDLGICEAEGLMGSREIATMIVRTVTVILTLLGGVWLFVKIRKSGRGSWGEALVIIFIQIIWQVLSWYRRHIDQNWVFGLSCGNVDSETALKVYMYFENLVHCLAMYSGLVIICRLASLVGSLLYILMGMSVLIPVVFSTILLLLDMFITSDNKSLQSYQIGISSFRLVILHLLPLGLVLTWTMTQCAQVLRSRGRRSHREMASNVIAAAVIVFHLVSVAQFVVYILIKTSLTSNDDEFLEKLVNADLALTEVSYLLACLALPWAWLLGLKVPLNETNQLETNLKLAKQNKQRNIIKYEKEKSNVATPPTSPFKFSPEVTSSPSIISGNISSSHQTLPPKLPPLPRPDMNPSPQTGAASSGRKEKRRSYQEAVSNSNLNVLENAPPRQSKSIEPLWLPSGKPAEL